MSAQPDASTAGDEPGLERARRALDAAGIAYTITHHGPVRSLAEAAAARGVAPSGIVKTLVVRRGADDHLFVLVPGGREISWKKLRAHLGINRISMPDAAGALAVTGYERGTITPFGAAAALPVVMDAHVTGTVSIGAGAHGAGATVATADLVAALGADVADVTDATPET